MNKLYFEHIGKPISKAEVNLERVLQKGLINFSVNKELIYLSDGTLIPGKVAIRKENSNKIFGITGEDYCIVNNIEAFDFTEELAYSYGFSYERAGSYDKDNNAFVVMSLKTNRDIEDYIFVSNNCGGNGSVTIYITPVICGEILIPENYKLSIRHSKNVKERMFLCQEIVRKCSQANESVAAMASLFSKEELEVEEFLNCLRELFKSDLNSTNIKIERAENAISFMLNSFKIKSHNKFSAILSVSEYECNRSSMRETGNPEVYLNRILNGMPLTLKMKDILRRCKNA